MTRFVKSMSSVLLVLVCSLAASGETLTFSKNEKVTIPSGFTGEIVVEGGEKATKVEATFEGDAEVVLRLAGMAQFVKFGTGTPTLRAYRGANAGTVEIAEGSATWGGASGAEAPGAFNVVKVRSLASLAVTNSPAAMRHAYTFRGGVRRDETTQEENDKYKTWTGKDVPAKNYKAAYNCTYEVFDQGLWEGFFQQTTWPGAEGTREGVVTADDGEAMFNGRDEAYPTYYYDSKEKLWLHYRAMFVVARKGQKTVEINQNVAAGKVFIDGVGNDGHDGVAVITNADWNLDVGFHEIAASSYFNGDTSGKKRSFFLSRPVEFGGDDGRWESGLLWHGACCNALVVEEGGIVTVAAGQALGVAQTDGCEIEGDVEAGGDGSVLALLSTSTTVASPENWFSLGALAGFSGTVELGKSVRAYVPADVSFAGTVDGGEATVAFGAADAVGAVSSFDGTAVVPDGVTIPAGTFTDAVRVIGTGTLAVSDPANAPESFSGNLAFDGCDVRLGQALNPSSGVTLDGTGTLNVDARARYEAARLTAEGFGDWLLCGQTAVGTGTLPDETKVTFDKATAPVLNEDGTLTLTYDTGKQVHGAFMGDLDLTADACVELDFDMKVDLPSETIPSKFADHGVTEQAKAGTFMMLVANSEPGTFFGKELYGEGSYGFRASFYEGGNFAGVYNGFIDDKLDGFPTDAPIHVNLRVAAGVMSVTLTGKGGTQSYQADVSDAFKDGQTAHLALLGSTDWWDKSTTLVTSRITLSNLRVSRTNTDEPPYVHDTAIDASKTGWTVNKTNEWTTVGDKAAFPVIPNTRGGGRMAVCNTPVALDRPWTYTWKAQHTAEVGSGMYVYQSFYLQGEGPLGEIVKGDTNPTRPMANSACYGFSLDTGHAKSGSDKNAFIWLNGKITEKPKKDEWIQETWTRPKAGSTVVNTVRYDGQGGLSLSILSEGETFTTNLVMSGLAELAKSGAKWYITHVGYNNAGDDAAAAGKVFAYDTNFRAADYSVSSPAEVRPAIEVAAGADQTITLGDYSAVGSVPAVSFPSLAVGDGSTVTVATSAVNAWATISTLTADGATALKAGANARVSLETVVAKQNGSSITLGGEGTFALDSPVRIVVPKAKTGDVPRLVIDYKDATFAGGDPERKDFTVVYDDGTSVPEKLVKLSNIRLTVDAASRVGLSVFIR